MNHKIKRITNRMCELLPLKPAVKNEYRNAYEKELLKQTMTYAYWIRYCEINPMPLPETEKKDMTCVTFTHICEVDFKSVTTQYMLLSDRRGILAPNAVDEICRHLDGNDFVYTDHDMIQKETGRRHSPFFKPDWSPDTFLCFQYIGHLFAVRTDIAKRIDIVAHEDADVALYDFLLKYTEKVNSIYHIPMILYHRFEYIGAAAPEDELEKFRMVREIAKRRRGYELIQFVQVSIIIPSKDNPEILKQCILSIRECTLYPSYEIIVVDNGSKREVAAQIQQFLSEIGARYVYEPMNFNYSKMCNLGVQYARGEYLLFLNDDITIERTCGYMTVMLQEAMKAHVGAVGAKLLYPDSDFIQHVGITCLKCGPSHKLASYPDNKSYYFGRNRLTYNCIAVTGACLMVSKEKFLEVGGFNVKMKVGYNDISLCASLVEAGYYNVVRNDVMLYHHESLSRGTDIQQKDKYERLLKERVEFYRLHPELRNKDPFYNPNLIQEDIVYEPNVVPDCNSRYYRNGLESIDRQKVRLCEGCLQFSLESVTDCLKEELNESDYIRIEGWSFLQGFDNTFTTRYLVLQDEQKKKLYFHVSPKYRKDVKEVFPQEKGLELAGFVCKINRTELREHQNYAVKLAIYSVLTSDYDIVTTGREINN